MTGQIAGHASTLHMYQIGYNAYGNSHSVLRSSHLLTSKESRTPWWTEYQRRASPCWWARYIFRFTRMIFTWVMGKFPYILMFIQFLVFSGALDDWLSVYIDYSYLNFCAGFLICYLLHMWCLAFFFYMFISWDYVLFSWFRLICLS